MRRSDRGVRGLAGQSPERVGSVHGPPLSTSAASLDLPRGHDAARIWPGSARRISAGRSCPRRSRRRSRSRRARGRWRIFAGDNINVVLVRVSGVTNRYSAWRPHPVVHLRRPAHLRPRLGSALRTRTLLGPGRTLPVFVICSSTRTCGDGSRRRRGYDVDRQRIAAMPRPSAFEKHTSAPVAVQRWLRNVERWIIFDERLRQKCIV